MVTVMRSPSRNPCTYSQSVSDMGMANLYAGSAVTSQHSGGEGGRHACPRLAPAYPFRVPARTGHELATITTPVNPATAASAFVSAQTGHRRSGERAIRKRGGGFASFHAATIARLFQPFISNRNGKF